MARVPAFTAVRPALPADEATGTASAAVATKATDTSPARHRLFMTAPDLVMSASAGIQNRRTLTAA
jgi:hypothetical protein